MSERSLGLGRGERDEREREAYLADELGGAAGGAVRVGERVGLEDGGVERAVEQDLSHGPLVLLLLLLLAFVAVRLAGSCGTHGRRRRRGPRSVSRLTLVARYQRVGGRAQRGIEPRKRENGDTAAAATEQRRPAWRKEPRRRAAGKGGEGRGSERARPRPEQQSLLPKQRWIARGLREGIVLAEDYRFKSRWQRARGAGEVVVSWLTMMRRRWTRGRRPGGRKGSSSSSGAEEAWE